MIVYKITNTVNNKVYIGQTVGTLKRRMTNHKSAINSKRNKHTLLHMAFIEYGIENFNIEEIEKCNNIDELNNREIYWIKQYNSTNREFGYNFTRGGGDRGTTRGIPLTEEHKRKIGDAQLGVKNHRFGKPISDMHKKSITKKLSVPIVQLTKSGEYIREWKSIREASIALNIDDSQIVKVCKGKAKTIGGYRWKYREGNGRIYKNK